MITATTQAFLILERNIRINLQNLDVFLIIAPYMVDLVDLVWQA